MKYILKKEYPGSPKLGNTIDNLENDWIENYPEFWEEVVVKVKQKLFTTEDKIDIFKGDDYYYTDIKWKIHKGTNAKINSGNLIGVKGYNYFSTKEKAEEFILLNKPCLSYGDVQEYLKVKDCNKVLDLAQSKIQQSV